MTQTNLDEYEHIDRQIQRSKIKRYPYKEYLGESLTTYCHRCFNMGLSSTQTLAGLIKEIGIINLFTYFGPQEKDNINKNLWISVCARYTEYKRFN